MSGRSLRAAWPLVIRRVPCAKRLRDQAQDGLPLRESKRRLYAELVGHLGAGPFLGGRETPSLADLAAWPQFAPFYCMAFRGGDDVLSEPALWDWLCRVAPYVDGEPPMLPASVRRRSLP